MHAEDGRRALLQRIVAEARAQPTPVVAPEHAAATARLQQLQASFFNRLPAWQAAEERRVAALLQQRERAEEPTTAGMDTADGTSGPETGLTEGPALAGSTNAEAPVPAPAHAAAAEQTHAAAGHAPPGCDIAPKQTMPQEQAAQQKQQDQVLPPHAPAGASPSTESLAPAALQLPLPPLCGQQAQQVEMAQQAQTSTAPEEQHLGTSAAPEAQQACKSAASEQQQLLAAKEAAMALVEILVPLQSAQAEAQPRPMLPQGFCAAVGVTAAMPEHPPAASPLHTPRAPARPQGVPTPLLPPGLGAVRTPGTPAGAPSPAALATAAAAARARSGARAPLFLTPAGPAQRPPAPAQQRQALSRSGSGGSVSDGTGAVPGSHHAHGDSGH